MALAKGVAYEATLINEEEYLEAADSYQGWCTTCSEFTHDTAEPDAREYQCPVCEQFTVYGAEEALLRGLLAFK